jgi:hypothetical protein
MKTAFLCMTLAGIAYVFSSCVSIPNIHSDSRVSPADKTGYLFLEIDIQGDPDGLVFGIARTDAFLVTVGEWRGLKAGRNIIFVKAPAGKYALDTIFDRSLKRVFTDFALETFPAAVKNGVITYTGKLLVDVSETVNEYQNKVVDIRYSWRDEYAGALEYIRTAYPGIPDTVHVLNECPDVPEGRYYRSIVLWGR